jgi:very-short-patch-repair endonuclease
MDPAVMAGDRAGSEGAAGAAIRLDHRRDARAVSLADQRAEIPLEHPDRLIGALAAEQDAVVTFAQLRALGLGRGAIASRRRRGLLHALHVGVYRWGSIASPATTVRAAVLACGARAVASHHAAIALYGIRALPARPIDVTTIGRHVAPRGVRPHTAAALHPADRRILRGIPVTAPARALLEVAAQLTPRELANAVEQAQIMRLVTKAEVIAAIDRAPRRRGAGALRALAEDPAFTRSRAERKLVALLRAARLPEPVFNAFAEGWEVDALWERERVVLEFDSYGFHATRAAFERDRRKTSDLTRGRYLVLRTTWTELTQRSYALIARSAEALSAGASSASRARGGP